MAELPLPRSKHFYKRWWFWLIVIILIGIVGGVVFGAMNMTKKRLASYNYLKDSVRVTRRSLQKTIATTGTIVPDGMTQLVVAAPGKVREIRVAVGDTVEEGAVLLVTDAAVGKELKAPFDGRVLAIDTVVGDTVALAQPVMTFGYRTSHVEFFASDNDIIDLKKDQRATMTVPVYKNGREKFTGNVTSADVQKTTNALAAVSQSAATQTGYRVRVNPDNMPDELLRVLGLSVDVTITVADRPNVLSLERSAMQYDENDGSFVYKVPDVNEEFTKRASEARDVTTLLEKKDITIGFEGDDYVEVVAGLAEDEEVLLYIPVRATSPF